MLQVTLILHGIGILHVKKLGIKCIFYPAPGKAALYYSPCGKLFTNWAQVTASTKGCPANVVEIP